PATPIIASQANALEVQRIHEVEEILGNGCLLGHAWRRRIKEAGGPIATQIRYQHPIPSSGEWWRHGIPGMNVIRKPVQQHDGEASRIPVGDVAYVERRGAHGQVWRHRDLLVRSRSGQAYARAPVRRWRGMWA